MQRYAIGIKIRNIQDSKISATSEMSANYDHVFVVVVLGEVLTLPMTVAVLWLILNPDEAIMLLICLYTLDKGKFVATNIMMG
jgi:hypothetical protein